MSSTSVIFLALIFIVCILLVVVIMVQNPKGSGLSSTFGGSSGQQMGGVKKTNDFLSKSTWTLATALLVLILLYNITSIKGAKTPDSKIINGDEPISAPAEGSDQQEEQPQKEVNPNQNPGEQENTLPLDKSDSAH